MDAWRTAEGPLLYAHRGASIEHSENTLPAFVAALALGADALELDVHLTRDRQVVVSHDEAVGAAAGGGTIRDHDLATVQGWDVGAASRRVRGPGGAEPARIPTLAEVLAALPSARLNVDLKTRDPALVSATVACVRAAGAESRVLLTSFFAATVATVRASGYAGPMGLCQRDAVRAYFWPMAMLRRLPLPGARLQIPARYGPLVLDTPALIRKVHALGVAVDYWVINDPIHAAALLTRGADGLVTDDPRGLARVFAVHPRTAGWRARHPHLAETLAGAGR